LQEKNEIFFPIHVGMLVETAVPTAFGAFVVGVGVTAMMGIVCYKVLMVT